MGSEWVEAWVAKLKKRRSDASVKDANFQERQRIKRDQGPQVWSQVRQWLMDKFQEINNGMSEAVLQGDPNLPQRRRNEIGFIYNSEQGMRRLHVGFDQKAGSLIAKCKPGPNERKWELSVGEDGKAYFCVGAIPSEPEAVAEACLNILLNGCTEANSTSVQT